MRRSGVKARFLWMASALVLAVPAAHAQQVLAHASSVAPPPGSALPPPGINDPGEQAVPLPSTGIPPSVAPAARTKDSGGDSTNVTSRTDANGDKIEEYRRGGQLIMVRVTPKHGVTQIYKLDRSNGSLVRDPATGPVAPVYYDVYKWGGPKKPASSAAETPASAGSGGR